MQQQGTEVVSGKDFRRMIAAAHRTFMREHESINSLNVFPVPDGDTGTNMLLTLAAVSRSVAEAADLGIGSLSKRAADSAIMGARGNSGVILSQIFRGIARGLAGKEEATSSEVGKAFEYGVLYAYRAVARPVEGTILTVAKAIAKGAQRAMREKAPFADILTAAINAGTAELARTPELLPALKSAGVVDAGGQGLIVFLEGCLEGLQGTYNGPEADFERELTFPIPASEMIVDISHPYCTEFVIKQCNAQYGEIKKTLMTLGESLVLAEGNSFIKVHIHTAHPGTVLESAITWGTLHDIKIDNMADQHRGKYAPVQEKTGLMVISVVSGDGLAEIMHQMDASIIISGGQTMNPPVEDFISAIHGSAAEKYIILPNNKNIVLAALQVKKLLGDRVEIIPTVNVPQGLAALMAYDAKEDMALNLERMKEASAKVKSGSVTVAVRDSVAKGRRVLAGSFIGVVDNRVLVDATDLKAALIGLVRELMEADSEVVSLYYGSGVSMEEASSIAKELEGELEHTEVQLYYGGQPLYQFIISVE